MKFCLHDWSKWQQFEVAIAAQKLWNGWTLRQAVEVWQMKTCKKCNKQKQEYIRTYSI